MPVTTEPVVEDPATDTGPTTGPSDVERQDDDRTGNARERYEDLFARALLVA
ncbi:hypothetical protein ACIRQY_05395 [Streptomyces sp. NPDC101490]|uniref:hypothetical protein n=1 Tax=Streptomyces sp. NPDC101490 TaxID=3366143 RepID=UPI003804B57E